MKTLICIVLLTGLSAACLAAGSPGSPLGRIQADGWYVWTIESVPGMQCRCCSGGRGVACGPDSDEDGTIVADGAADSVGPMRIYVMMGSGRPVRLRVFGANCRVKAGSSVTDLGVVDADTSVAWLSRYIEPRSKISSDVIEAINEHGNEASVTALTGIVMNGHDVENRKEALFWLAQSDSMSAFEFLDRLLTKRP